MTNTETTEQIRTAIASLSFALIDLDIEPDEFDSTRQRSIIFWLRQAIEALTKAVATPIPERCLDCQEAAKHAFSDSTTAGFHSSLCAKHRGGDIKW